MNRKELSLRIGMALAGARIPPDGDSAWEAIRMVNRADIACRLGVKR